MTNMNVDKAYLLGLIIGGGVFGKNDNSFHIRLPYKRWGSVEKNPARAGKIAKDILNVVSPMMRGIYGIDATYDVKDKEWNVQCYGDLAKLKNDLVHRGDRFWCVVYKQKAIWECLNPCNLPDAKSPIFSRMNNSTIFWLS